MSDTRQRWLHSVRLEKQERRRMQHRLRQAGRGSDRVAQLILRALQCCRAMISVSSPPAQHQRRLTHSQPALSQTRSI